jgi:uncharacterized protein (TIGR02271 family)
MTVSEERLYLDKQTRLRERVRLRKYVVTEEVQVTVPVRREHLRLERELVPEDEAETGVAEIGGSMEDYSIVLLEETVVVDKRVVPRERVRVQKEVVTETQQISETVRREQIDFEHDGIRRDPLSSTEEEATWAAWNANTQPNHSRWVTEPVRVSLMGPVRVSDSGARAG